ncbi:hypothetical protein GLS40_05525 [Pseudooceanicola sp. 216_PA32_1]|uniref:Bifunctional hemolysin/adenylate cyclase n=1 Tax=Pseudooceanicola pacificus TaxID=2676438 RepID=A0A844WA61_9RHOB|nr:FG-GAP repeat protein [Pseudooceanicola pacificus]MWB77478.1 hypothetical protein [Pseudooceanicola pacificus]
MKHFVGTSFTASFGTKAGADVTAIGDFNGDGIEDFAVGMPYFDVQYTGRNYTYLFYSTYTLTYTYTYTNTRQDAGAVAIVFGTAEGLPTQIDLENMTPDQGFLIGGANYYGSTGFAVAGIGDVNGDGLADVLIGAPYSDGNPTPSYNTGRAYVVFGDATPNVQPATGIFDLHYMTPGEGIVIAGGQPGVAAGFEVVRVGDFNGDGIEDFGIASAYGEAGYAYGDYNYIGQGNLLIVMGDGSGGLPSYIDISAPPPGSVMIENVGLPTYGYGYNTSFNPTDFGTRADGGGDFNGDGYDDLIIAAQRAAFKTYTPSYVYSSYFYTIGGVSYTNIYTFTYYPLTIEYSTGAAYIVFGDHVANIGSTITVDFLNGTDGVIFYGNAGERVGSDVASLGDINGDGFDDYIVGAADAKSLIPNTYTYTYTYSLGYYAYQAGGNYTKSYSFYTVFQTYVPYTYTYGGGGYSLFGTYTYTNFNYVGSGNGSYTNKGTTTAQNTTYYSRGTGRAYVILGQGGPVQALLRPGDLNSAFGFIIENDSVGQFLGQGVGGIGDVNGDGYDDMAVVDEVYLGAGGSYDATRINVIFGGPTAPTSGFNIADIDGSNGFQLIIPTGGVIFDPLSRLSGGDFDGDGFDDIVFGYMRNYGSGYSDFNFTEVLTGGSNARFAALDGLDGSVDGKIAAQFIGDGVQVGDTTNDEITTDGVTYLVLGLAGNDTIEGSGQTGIEINGGGGIDMVSYEDAAGGLTADLANNANNTGAASGDTFISIEDLRGTAFADTLRGNGGANLIQGLAGDDEIEGGGNNDTLAGGAGNDFLNGGTGNDRLVGGNNDDTLLGGAGADDLLGGGGIDLASYEDAATGVRADLQFPNVNTGDAAGDTYDSIENLNGSGFADNLRGDTGDNRIRGLAGDDQIYGRAGNDTLFGEAGNDYLFGGINDDELNGGADNDVLNGGIGADALNGGGGIDRAVYDDAAAGVVANLTNSALNTGDAAGDTYSSIENLNGSNFNDLLSGDGNNNEIRGLSGNDTINGLGGNDTLFGEAGNDSLVGGIGSDDLRGGADNDILVGGAGGDILNGGGGIDRADYDDSVIGLTVDLQFAVQNTGIAAGDSYIGIENLNGTAFNDDLRGDAGANLIRGLSGDDQILGRNGADTLYGEGGNDNLFGGLLDDDLYGGADNDVLTGGSGADMLNGGSGIDRAMYNDSATGLTVNMANAALNTGIAAGDTFLSIENLTGSEFADVLRGDTGANDIRGLGGFDLINGAAGNDTLFGQDGNDTLEGAAGDDELRGGAGDDDLVGGIGADILFGGGGADNFIFDVLDGVADTVGDFVVGTDMVGLDSSVMTSLTPGALPAGQFATGAPADANDFIIYQVVSGRLYYDDNGNGAGGLTLLAEFTGAPALTAADFFVF